MEKREIEDKIRELRALETSLRAEIQRLLLEYVREPQLVSVRVSEDCDVFGWEGGNVASLRPSFDGMDEPGRLRNLGAVA